METVGCHGNDLQQPSFFFPYKARLWMSQHPWSHMSGEARQPVSSCLTSPYVWGRQLSYLSGSASTCCWWFTACNADSWTHRRGINCAQTLTRVLSYALFSSSGNNQFLESSFVMEMKHLVQGGIKGKIKKDWLLTRLFPHGQNLLTSVAICNMNTNISWW